MSKELETFPGQGMSTSGVFGPAWGDPPHPGLSLLCSVQGLELRVPVPPVPRSLYRLPAAATRLQDFSRLLHLRGPLRTGGPPGGPRVPQASALGAAGLFAAPPQPFPLRPSPETTSPARLRGALCHLGLSQGTQQQGRRCSWCVHPGPALTQGQGLVFFGPSGARPGPQRQAHGCPGTAAPF